MENSGEKRLGSGMFVAMWIVVLVMLTFVFGVWEDHQYNPNQSIASSGGEITLERNRYNHYVLSGLINGEPVVFLLDTGATNVAIPAQLADKLGLEKGFRHKVRTANGIAEAYRTTIDSLEMGTIKLYDVQASINPGMTDNEILLGMSALKDLEFTQRGSTLYIKQLR